MLAARDGVRGPDAAAGAPGGRRASGARPYLLILGSFVAAVIGGAAAWVGSSKWGDEGGTASLRAPATTARKHFVPQLGGPLEAPFPSEPQSISCYSTAFVSGRTTLYREPGGRGEDPAVGEDGVGVRPGLRRGAAAAATGSRSRRPSSATASSPGCRPTARGSTA